MFFWSREHFFQILGTVNDDKGIPQLLVLEKPIGILDIRKKPFESVEYFFVAFQDGLVTAEKGSKDICPASEPT